MTCYTRKHDVDCYIRLVLKAMSGGYEITTGVIGTRSGARLFIGGFVKMDIDEWCKEVIRLN